MHTHRTGDFHSKPESNACLPVRCPGCPLDLSQPAGESGRCAAEGMGCPLCNLSLSLLTALSLARMTKRGYKSLPLQHRNSHSMTYSICGLTATYFLLQICSLFASCWCGSPSVLKRFSPETTQCPWLSMADNRASTVR